MALALAAVPAALSLSAAPAQAAQCTRTQVAIACKVSYEVMSGVNVLKLVIRYNYAPGANQVTADYGWIDGTNNGGRTWNGHLPEPANRFAYSQWRACAQDWHGHSVCTIWTR